MNTKKAGIMFLIGVVLVGGAFYGGTKYASGTNARTIGNRQTGMAGGQFNRMGARAGGFTSGEIISKDPTSITIKMTDGSTKIVLVATSTQVMKSTSGAVSDLQKGTSVVVTGTTNTDGSLTAQSVQIRPTGEAFPGIGRGVATTTT
jgi:hypothetical protein